MLQKHYTKQNSTTLNSIEQNSAHSGIQRKWPVQDNSQTKKLTGGRTEQSRHMICHQCLFTQNRFWDREVCPIYVLGSLLFNNLTLHKEDLIINIYIVGTVGIECSGAIGKPPFIPWYSRVSRILCLADTLKVVQNTPPRT